MSELPIAAIRGAFLEALARALDRAQRHIEILKNKKPTPVPPVIPETSIKKRRYEEANDRRNRRMRDAEKRKAKRSSWKE